MLHIGKEDIGETLWGSYVPLLREHNRGEELKNPYAVLKKTDLSEEHRIRNIVLFRHSFCKKCKQGLGSSDVRLSHDSYGTVRVTDPSWIPRIQVSFSRTSGDPFRWRVHQKPRGDPMRAENKA
jgi:hypothetical protein